MTAPLYLRLAFTDRTTLACLAAGAAASAAQAALGTATITAAAVQAAVFAAGAAAVIRECRRMRDLRAAIAGFVRAVKAFTPDQVYLDREARVVLTRPPGRAVRLYRAPEDDAARAAGALDDGGDTAFTADVFDAPFPAGWAVMAGNVGGVVRLGEDGEPAPVGAGPSRWAQARGRWMGLRTGTSIATAAELRVVCGQLARAERLDPEPPS